MAADDPIAQLKALAELRDAGIITAEEFAAKKAEVPVLKAARNSGVMPWGDHPLEFRP